MNGPRCALREGPFREAGGPRPAQKRALAIACPLVERGAPVVGNALGVGSFLDARVAALSAHRASSATGISRVEPERITRSSGWTWRSKWRRLTATAAAASSRVSATRGTGASGCAFTRNG